MIIMLIIFNYSQVLLIKRQNYECSIRVPMRAMHAFLLTTTQHLTSHISLYPSYIMNLNLYQLKLKPTSLLLP